MRDGLREAGAERSLYQGDAATDVVVQADRLRIRFVSGRDPRAAELAAGYTRALAYGLLQSEVGHGASNLAADAGGTQATLVVVIHLAGEPGPLIADECGGRVDWRIERDGLAEGSPGLTALQRQAGRLLADLGYLAPEVPAPHGSARRALPAASGAPFEADLLAA